MVTEDDESERVKRKTIHRCVFRLACVQHGKQDNSHKEGKILGRDYLA